LIIRTGTPRVFEPYRTRRASLARPHAIKYSLLNKIIPHKYLKIKEKYKKPLKKIGFFTKKTAFHLGIGRLCVFSLTENTQ